MRCGLHHNGADCGRPAQFHALVRANWQQDAITLGVCAFSLVLICESGGLVDGDLLAIHPTDVPCRHPHGEWDDDGCVLPVTTDTVEDVRTAQEVTA